MSDAERGFAKFEITRARTRELRAESARILQSLQVTERGLAEILNDLRATRSVASQHLARLQGVSADRAEREGANVWSSALAAMGLKERNLNDLTDDLIAAYRAAMARDDDEMQAALGGALRTVGHHIAVRLGPRAAGVNLS